ncbi:MAG: SPOUT family RNA methylase [Staphylothermus sp.]|nr:SPOUT family RNA methylase [Staphylothermus sp.]
MKTSIGFEKIVLSRIREIDECAETWPSPLGFKGLVLIKSCKYDRDALAKLIEEQVPEADKIIPIDLIIKADPNVICTEIKDLATSKISRNETFAVRTTRRGKHNFTSIDVNVIVGDCIRKYTNASVNLRYPDKIVLIEIIQDYAYIAILPGSFEYHKYSPEKKELRSFFKKIAIIQMPYLGPLDSALVMGKRIGREVQNFEVKELVIAPTGIVDAYQLEYFIRGVREGIESRYNIQLKSYPYKPRKTPVYLMDLHQLVRDRYDEVIIVFEPEGKYIGDVRAELKELVLRQKKRINLLFGSREGIPVGIYRYADLIVDVAPGITLSTDYAAAAGLIALATVLYHEYRSMDHESYNTRGR